VLAPVKVAGAPSLRDGRWGRVRGLANLDRRLRARARGVALAKVRGAKGTRQMLFIYDVIIEVLRLLRPVVRAIEKHDRDLARQLKRASTSVLLNTGEGSGTRGGSRMERYRTALGSARETTACIDASLALGYIERVDPELLDKLDRVRGTLVRLTR
jgi:four helix bundle protein